LESVGALDKIIAAIDLYSMNAQLGGLLNSPSYIGNESMDTLEQQVYIEAHFPEATDRNEIAEAINTLVNRASQYVSRR
jgi:hypothetical protein